MSPKETRSELLDLILTHSFRRERVVLSSGAESDFYLDLRQTLMRPLGVKWVGELILEKLQTGAPVEAVGGMAVGADYSVDYSKLSKEEVEGLRKLLYNQRARPAPAGGLL